MDELQFFFVSRMDQVLEAALELMPTPAPVAEEVKDGEKRESEKAPALASN